MNPEHERYAQWDAAYAIGALPAAERHEYEAHVAGCTECRSLIAELTPTVALLSRVSAQSVRDHGALAAAPAVADAAVAAVIASGAEPDGTAGASGPDPSVRHAVVRRARMRRLRRRIATGALAVTAAAAIAAAIAIPVLQPAAPTALVPMVNVAQSPLEASVALDSVAWGTRIELSCTYPEESGSAAGKVWTYVLAVVDTSGRVTTVSSWRAGPGSTATLSAGTALSMREIGSVEIRTEAGDVLTELPVSGDASAPKEPPPGSAYRS